MQNIRKLLQLRFYLSGNAFSKFYCGYIESEMNIQKRWYSESVNEPTTIRPDEVNKFGKHGLRWWEHDSSMLALMAMNELRVPFIRDGLLASHGKSMKSGKPLEGYQILDVGCGGGYLSEPLARLGATVTGLDASIDCINAAIHHAQLDPDLEGRLTYTCDVVENFKNSDVKFDAVVCSEVIEHVDSVSLFLESCTDLTKNHGSIFFTTVNRTLLSYWLVIVGYEYILRGLPVGTHDWNQFVTPEDLKRMLEQHCCRTVSVQGTMLNPFTSKWFWSPANSVTYALHAIKEV